MKNIFAEETGKASFARISGAIFGLAYVVSMLYLVFSKGEMLDIPETLAILIATMYGLNKFRLTGVLNAITSRTPIKNNGGNDDKG